MAYEIENYGPQATDGLRTAKVSGPTFPPNYGAGYEELSFTTDLIADPADDEENTGDPTTGWNRGIGGRN